MPNQLELQNALALAGATSWPPQNSLEHASKQEKLVHFLDWLFRQPGLSLENPTEFVHRLYEARQWDSALLTILRHGPRMGVTVRFDPPLQQINLEHVLSQFGIRHTYIPDVISLLFSPAQTT